MKHSANGGSMLGQRLVDGVPTLFRCSESLFSGARWLADIFPANIASHWLLLLWKSTQMLNNLQLTYAYHPLDLSAAEFWVDIFH